MHTICNSSHLLGVYLVLGGVPSQRGCTWSQGVPGPRECTWSQGVGGGVSGLRGVPGPRGCTWSQGMYLVPGDVPGPSGTWSWGDVPGPGGLYLVPGGVPRPGGCIWSEVYLVPGYTWCRGVPGPGGCLVLGGVPGPGGGYLPRYFRPVNRMTDRCKNITFAISLRTVITVNKNIVVNIYNCTFK